MSEVPKEERPEDDMRAKFKEALERKSQTAQAQQAHEEGRGKVKSMSGPAGGRKRDFRRKTG
ncbi:DUF5302 domain-containing protein [Streptomyces sp. NPDC102406]|uniref:DUF5302 domain-containing protein n=1 Tax=Streptomyces sp. NPDC102406 TaxID=3366171 RepID=UPI003803BE14